MTQSHNFDATTTAAFGLMFNRAIFSGYYSCYAG